MSFKLVLVGAALLALGGCVSAPYSPDTGYSQGYRTDYYTAPTYYYSYGPGGYVAAVPPPSPFSICTDTPAGC
ncbi:MAG TPA: hypothetical protein VGL83_00060 [Stellaceae bacterium]